jgi:hypothetical protein
MLRSKNVYLVFAVVTAVALATASCSPKNAVPAKGPASASAPAEKARIFFFKTSGIRASASVFKGYELVGGLPARSYFYVDVEPGQHIFHVSFPKYVLDLAVKAEAGKTYNVLVDVGRYTADLVPLAPGSDKWSDKELWLHELQHVMVSSEEKQGIEAAARPTIARKLSKLAAGGGVSVRLGPKHGI